MLCMGCFIFFFKQKTAYEMRIRYWSSDVCSSDLAAVPGPVADQGTDGALGPENGERPGAGQSAQDYRRPEKGGPQDAEGQGGGASRKGRQCRQHHGRAAATHRGGTEGHGTIGEQRGGEDRKRQRLKESHRCTYSRTHAVC